MPRKSERPWWKRALYFVIWRLILIGIIAGLLRWQWDNIVSWATWFATATMQLFGWGLVITAVLVVSIIIVIIIGKAIIFLHYWNKWLGIISLLAGIWGILAFFPGEGVLAEFTTGGRIGTCITGSQDVLGGLKIFGLFILAFILVAPRSSFHIAADFFSWLKESFQRKPSLPEPEVSIRSSPDTAPSITGQIPKTIPRYKPDFKPEKKAEPQKKTPLANTGSWLWARLNSNPAAVKAAPNTPPALPAEQPVAAEPEGTAPKSTQSLQEKKDLAEEVWKKYGENAKQVTADGWRMPAVDILDKTPEIEFSQADNMKRAKLIEDALSSYGVDSKVVQINVGPTVTQFGVEPGWDRKIKEVKEKDKNGEVVVKQEEVSRIRVKVDRITSLSNDLSLALAAPSIRIEAPVPGKSVVGIEVPNTILSLVSLRSVVESSSFQKSLAKSKLSIALGKGAGGEAVVGDLIKMPHLLIAGATGSGKTVCIHTIICSFLLYNTPAEVKFLMIDPKRVELTNYNSLPHLAAPVIVDTDRALSALRWLSSEMDKRYQTLASARMRNIESYNKGHDKDKLPYLVLIIDELADLMMTSGEEVEHTLCRLAQLARATGIHLVVATQRPSVDVVTGLIKANFPTRISFAVTSQVDSRTILDSGGAEKLLGRGDMLYMPTEAAKPKRLQGCYLSDAEIERIVYLWSSQRKEEYSQLRLEDLEIAGSGSRRDGHSNDPLLEEARQLLAEHKHISTSYLQRHLRIGYPRAARIMEQLNLDAEVEEDAEGTGEEDIEEEKS